MPRQPRPRRCGGSTCGEGGSGARGPAPRTPAPAPPSPAPRRPSTPSAALASMLALRPPAPGGLLRPPAGAHARARAAPRAPRAAADPFEEDQPLDENQRNRQ